jgi:hypothetical protein
MSDMFAVARFSGRSPYGRSQALSLDQLRDLLLDRCYPLEHKERGPGWSATRYLPEYRYERLDRETGEIVSVDVRAPAAHRRNEGVAAVTALVLDVDHRTPDWLRLADYGWLCFAYTTWSHTDADPRWRLCLPLAREVPADDWPRFWYSASSYFAIEGTDPACKDVSHLYWLHAAHPDADPLLPATRELGSRLLEPDAIPLRDLPAERTEALTPHPQRPPTDFECYRANRLLYLACERLAEHAPGGRQVGAYGYARLLGPWVAAGTLDALNVQAALWHACERNGVATESDIRASETARAITTGLARGLRDGAIDFDAPRVQESGP